MIDAVLINAAILFPTLLFVLHLNPKAQQINSTEYTLAQQDVF